MLELLLNDISSDDYGLCLTERPIIPTPQRDVEQIPVRGRNGSLTRKYGYMDIDIPVRLNLMTDALKGDVRHLKTWLLDATRLQFSDDSVYYLVNNVSVGDIENEISEYGVFDVIFNCKPFQHEDVSQLIYPPALFYNPGTEKAYPVLRITMTGTVIYNINGREFSLTYDGTITVDSEMGMAYVGKTPMDDRMAGEMPYLDPGQNDITYGIQEGQGDMTTMNIAYRVAYL